MKYPLFLPLCMLVTLRLSPIHRLTASGGRPTPKCESNDKPGNRIQDLTPRCTRVFPPEYLASVYQTPKQSLPDKPNGFDTRSRFATVGSVCPIRPTMLWDRVNDAKEHCHENSVLNLSKDWLVVPTWSSAGPMALQSSRFRCVALRRRHALDHVRVNFTSQILCCTH